MNRLFPKKLQKEYDWAFAHYSALAKRYPNQWVAFANGRVLAAGPRLTTVLRLASRKQKIPQVPHLFVESGIHVYDAYRA
jgi:hypothetical protein